MKEKQKRILIIVGRWPSKTHPYLSALFLKLKEHYPALRLFRWDTSSDTDSLLQPSDVARVLTGSLVRQKGLMNPLIHMKVWVRMIIHLPHVVEIVKEGVQKEMSFFRIYSQLFYFNALLGKRFHLVHINALQTAFHFKLFSFFRNAAVVSSSRGQDFDFYPDRYDHVLQAIQGLHVLGKYLESQAVSRDFPKEKICIIPPVSALGEQKKTTAVRFHEKTGVHIATAARLSWLKGHVYVIRALGMLKVSNPSLNITYHIFGDGDDLPNLIIEVNRLQLQDNVKFHGWVSHEQLEKSLEGMDLYVLTSFAEGFNNSVLLAQAMGLPCIVSDAGGLPESIEPGVTGLVVPRYSATAIADAILKIVNSGAEWEVMSVEARKRADFFSIDQQVTRYISWYDSFLSASK